MQLVEVIKDIKNLKIGDVLLVENNNAHSLIEAGLVVKHKKALEAKPSKVKKKKKVMTAGKKTGYVTK